MKLLEDVGSFKINYGLTLMQWGLESPWQANTLYEVQLKTIPQVNDPVSILSFIPCTAFWAKGTLAGAKGKKTKGHGFQIRMIQKPKEFGKYFVDAK